MKKKSHYLAAEKSASLQREKVFSRFNIHLNKTIFPRVNSETEVTKSPLLLRCNYGKVL